MAMLVLITGLLSGCKPKAPEPTPSEADPFPVYPKADYMKEMTEKAREMERQYLESLPEEQRPVLNRENTLYTSKDPFEKVVKYYEELFAMTPVSLEGVAQPPQGDRVAIRDHRSLKEQARGLAQLGVNVDPEDTSFNKDFEVVGFMFQDAGALLIFDRFINTITGKAEERTLINRIVEKGPPPQAPPTQ